MQSVQLKNFRIYDDSQLGREDELLAIFDAEFGGLLVSGCTLRRLPAGNTVADGPSVRVKGGHLAIPIRDNALRREIHTVAFRTYRAIKGIVDTPSEIEPATLAA